MPNKRSVQDAWKRTVKCFKRRIKKIAKFTVPIYILFFFLDRAGLFNILKEFVANLLTWLSPKALSMVAAESTAGLAAAGALLQDGSMDYNQVVLALLVGNVLSSPIRAARHQFPYYF